MTWANNLFATTLFVSDLDVSKAFYSMAFEKSLIFEDPHSAVFGFGEVLINLLSQSEAPSLISPATVAAKESGSRIQFTIQVDDVDARVKRLKELGIPIVNGPMDRPWGVRTALIADPDGHLWELAQP